MIKYSHITFTITSFFDFSDPAVFGTLRVQQPMTYDSTTTRAQNLVEILHHIKKFYQVCFLGEFELKFSIL